MPLYYFHNTLIIVCFERGT